MAVALTELSCRIGTVRLPRTCPLEEAELASMIELELAQLVRWSPDPPPPGDLVVRSPRLAVHAPASSPPTALARLIALQIYQRIQRGGIM
jgi:hypothetical protein